MADMYAWSDITVTPAAKDANTPATKKVLSIGSKVAKGDLPEGEYDELVEAGVLRPYKYPDMGAQANNMSPVAFAQAEARKLAEGDPEAQVVAAREAAEEQGVQAQQPATQ